MSFRILATALSLKDLKKKTPLVDRILLERPKKLQPYFTLLFSSLAKLTPPHIIVLDRHDAIEKSCSVFVSVSKASIRKQWRPLLSYSHETTSK